MSHPQVYAPAAPQLLTFVLGALVGEISTLVLLWDLGQLIALSGMPFGGAVVGVCAAGIIQRT